MPKIIETTKLLYEYSEAPVIIILNDEGKFRDDDNKIFISNNKKNIYGTIKNTLS